VRKNVKKIFLFSLKKIKQLKNELHEYFAYLVDLLNKNIMQQGTVKFFNETKGFGFITPNDGGSEIFVHSTGLIDNIRENNTVSYDVEEGRKGPNAVNVKIA